jgi:predicted GIY-YIG superfamily endonuclease
MIDAITQEKQIKAGSRAKKLALIEALEQILIRRDHNRLRRRSSGTLGQ